VHLARDPLGLGVDALGGAVAVRKCERGDHGVAVSVQAPGEGMQMGQVGCVDLADPAREPVGISFARRQELGEVSDTGCQCEVSLERHRGDVFTEPASVTEKDALTCRG
jgi:hypothetical protein